MNFKKEGENPGKITFIDEKRKKSMCRETGPSVIKNLDLKDGHQLLAIMSE